MNTDTYTFTVVLEPDETGGYVASCPILPGVVTEGETVEETLERARDAVQGYLASLRKDGLAIPEEHGPIVSPIKVTLARV